MYISLLIVLLVVATIVLAWSWSVIDKVDSNLRSIGDAHQALNEWLRENDPDLLAQISDMDLNAARVRLNEVTGINVLSSDLVGEGYVRFLAALKAGRDE
jgi:CBS-domain-containing membrane protein